MKHELKTYPQFFEPVDSGVKRFELRRSDRGFKVGDVLHLREWLPDLERYTGQHCYCKVLYILERKDFKAVPTGHVLLSIELIG